MNTLNDGGVCSSFSPSDLQVVTSPIHRLWRWPHAAAGGARGPAARPFQTYLPALLQGPETLAARLQEKPGWDSGLIEVHILAS